ncbi:MAG TPA: acyl-CoA dehydrogenase, partial [Mycobacteriales bacterium]|nr:acyl-CoA dehydrogenase [Mycobacteriales bacterium]
MTSTVPASVDPARIQEVLDGRWAHVRQDAREHLGNPEYAPVYGETMQEARERISALAKKLAGTGRVGLGFPKAYGGNDDGTPCQGVTIGDDGPKAGLNGVDNGRLTFDHVRVPRENLLDRYGQVAEDGTYTSSIENETRRFFTMLGTLVRGRVSVGGAAGSATKLALDIAVRYGDVRRQFAAPGKDREIVINDYLVHQRKLLPALATSYALHFAQGELVETMHDVQYKVHVQGQEIDEESQRELESRAAGLKVAQTWHATRTIQMCREACGGAGYLAENRLPALKADTDVFTTFEGDNTVLLQLVAKGLLTGYRDAFGSLDGWGKVGFIADMVRETVLERTAARGLVARLVDAVPGRDDEVPMLDRGWQLKLFEFREKHTLEGAIRRLRKNAATEGMEPFDMFNDVQDHVLATAQSHIDRVVIESFVAGIERTTDAGARALLEKVCDLYALWTIEENKAWFLEHGQLTPTRGKTLTATVNGLLRELRPHLRTLVDAFGSLDGWGRVGFIADMVRETVLERTAARGLVARLVDAVPGRGDDVPMLDRGWQLKLFQFREKHTLEGAIRRLRKNAATEGMEPFDMFNDVQDHVLATAQSHIDRVVLESFV